MKRMQEQGRREPGRQIGVTATLSRAGLSPRQRVPDSLHDGYELVVLTRGACRVLVGGEIVPLDEGDALLIGPGTPHRHADPSKRTAWLLRFSIDCVSGALAERMRGLGPWKKVALPPGERERWSARCRLVADCLRSRSEGEEDVVRALLRALLSRFIARATGASPASVTDAAFDVIEARHRGRLTLADVARAVGLSPAYLTDLVHKETGHPVHYWITERRMRSARLRLAETKQSIGRIANDVGYADASHFSRAFLARTGMTPQRWRQSMARLRPTAAGGSRYDLDPVRTMFDNDRMVCELARSLTRASSFSDTAEHAAATAAAIFRPNLTLVYRRPIASSAPWPLAAAVPREDASCAPSLQGSGGLMPMVVDGQTLCAEDLDRAPNAHLAAIGALGFSSLLIAPIGAGERCCKGALLVLERRTRTFSEYDRSVLALIAAVCALGDAGPAQKGAGGRASWTNRSVALRVSKEPSSSSVPR